MKVEPGDRRFRAVAPTAPRADDPDVMAATAAFQSPKIYYVKVSAYIKIGYTTKLRNRMRAYPPDSELLAVIPFGTPQLEQRHHQDMRVYRAAGREWFHPSDELMQRIAEIVAEHGTPPTYWSPWKRPKPVPYAGPQRVRQIT